MEEAFKINQKTNRIRNDTAVQGTNDSSVLSKISAAQCGYHSDVFLKHFATKTTRRSPLVNRGYYIRLKLIDFVIQEFLYKTNQTSTRNQIINLGAGFDSSFFRLKHLDVLQHTIFIDIDFPDVINRKVALIEKTPALHNLCPDLVKTKDINGNTLYKSAESNYWLIGMDMRNTKLLEAFLKAIDDFSDSTPTFLLSEVVLTYMAVNSCNGVIQWIAEVLSDCVVTIYEQINPHDGFGQVMCSHFKKLGSPLKCILKYPTELDQINRYKQAGFTNCYTIKASDFYKDAVSNEEKSRIEKLELFDEYEAWHLKCTHYILLSATKGEFCETVTQASYDKSGVDVTNMMASLNLSGGLAAIIKPSIVTMEPCEVKFGLRFGHRMSLIGSNLFVFGGFGELASDVLGKHLRISAIEVFNLAANQLSVIELPGGAIGDRIFHDCVTLGKDTIYLTFGRSNPSKLFDSIIKIKVTANKKGCVVDSSQIVAEQVAIVNQAELGVLPRFRHATCATVDDKLFLHGGKFYDESASSNLILNDAYVLDDTNKLVKVNVDESQCTARHSHSITAWNEFMVLSGGIDQNENPLNDIILINSRTFEFTKLAITRGNVLPRYSHTSHVFENYLILIGGVNYNQIPPGICIVDLNKKVAFEFKLPDQTIYDTPFLALCHQTHMLEKNKILFVGGGAVCFTFGTHLNRQPVILELSECWRRVEQD